jgi:hypothetical protein
MGSGDMGSGDMARGDMGSGDLGRGDMGAPADMTSPSDQGRSDMGWSGGWPDMSYGVVDAAAQLWP